MADRRESAGSPEDDPGPDPEVAPPGRGGRRRRSEMSRRELRRRAGRAARAAREGDARPGRRRRSVVGGRDEGGHEVEPLGDAGDDADAAAGEEADADAGEDSNAVSEADPDMGGTDDLDVGGDVDTGSRADAESDAGSGSEVDADETSLPGAGAVAGGEAGPAESGRVGAMRQRGRRRRGKRRDRDRSRVQDRDPLDVDQGADHTSGEVLFTDVDGDDPAGLGADDPDPASPGEENDPENSGDESGPESPVDDVTDREVPRQDDEEGVDEPEEDTPEAERDPEPSDLLGAASERARNEPVDPDRSPSATPAAPAGPTRTSRLVAAVLGLLALVILGLVAMQLGWIDLARDMVGPAAEDEVAAEPPADGWQPAFLLAAVDDQVPGGELRSLAVLATDRREERGTVLLVPTTVVADVPGFGSFTLREAWELGGSALVAVTVDNLLGLHIDGVLAVDGAGWASWFASTDGADLAVGARIVPRDGHDRQPVEPGTRRATPEEVANYALIHGQGETELDVLPRTRQVLDALFAAIADDRSVLDAVVDAGRTFPGTVTPDRIQTVMGELADHREQDAVTSVSLPVVPLGSGDEDLYRSDDERLSSVIDERFAASRDDRTVTERLALQILNGNGRPGVGQEVAERLADGSYRIVLTGNADRFTYDATRIVVYSEDAEILRAAQDIQERLGEIGTIERAGTPQSVVDITIVVGNDFPP